MNSLKKKVIVCAFAFSLSIPAASRCMASEWNVVGEKGLLNAFSTPSIVVANNTPYVAFVDNSTGRPMVKAFDGAVWKTVGTISTQPTADISLAKGSDESLYVLFADYTQGYKATVKRLRRHSSTWQAIGDAGFTEGTINFGSSSSIAVYGGDTLYIAYVDSSHANKATVMKYDSAGNRWITVGTPGFSAGNPSYIGLAIDSAGIPYVAYQDVDNDNSTPDKATVMKFNGTSWELVGMSGVSAGYAWDVTIAIDSHDVPYLGFRDMDIGEKATVMKYANGAWQYVGIRGFSKSFAPYISLTLDDTDIPYVVFSDKETTWKATAMKFNGSAWENVGSPGFSDDVADQTKIILGDDDIYVLYQDYSVNSRFSVMKYSRNSGSTGSIGSIDLTGSSVSRYLPFLPILLQEKH